MLDYQWIARSICLASPRLARDIIKATQHVHDCPLEQNNLASLTAIEVDRLDKLVVEINKVLG